MTAQAAQQSTAPTDTKSRLLEKLAKKKQVTAAAAAEEADWQQTSAAVASSGGDKANIDDLMAEYDLIDDKTKKGSGKSGRRQ